MEQKSFDKIYELYTKAAMFNQSIGLYDTVENNENFYIGKQWEGVQTNGNPAPVFNIVRLVLAFQVAKISTDNFAFHVSGMGSTGKYSLGDIERICDVVNKQLVALVERNKIVSKHRQFARNAGADGDACFYSYWDPNIETGQEAKGDIVTEIVENTRVHFGNPSVNDAQAQPWIIIATRRQVAEVKRQAKQNGFDPDVIQSDTELSQTATESLNDDKVTVLIYMERDPETGHIWGCHCTQGGMVAPFKDTQMKRYPVVWMNWDYVQDNYHGYALITQVIPNQVYINKFYAMSFRSMSTSAYPKTLYDSTRIDHWESGVGRAIAVKGGDLQNVAKVLDPAPISPQVAQFIQMAIDDTKSLLGASDVALGNTRPDNTSAIIALQRASDAPLEVQKQNLYQALEDLALVYLDMIRAYYGKRYAQVKMLSKDQMMAQPLGMTLPEKDFNVVFDFDVLNEIPVSLKVDVGAASYWSEIAAAQTLDNLIRMNVISLDEYLERIPDSYITKKQELIDKRRGAMMMQGPAGAMAPTPSGPPTVDINQPIPVEGGGGNRRLQRTLNALGSNI